MLWVPPAIGYKDRPQGTPETLVYEVEVVDIDAGAADAAGRRGSRRRTPRRPSAASKYVVVRPGTGKDEGAARATPSRTTTPRGTRRPDVRHDRDAEAAGEDRRRIASRRRSKRS